MAKNFLTNLDLSGNQLLNATFEKLASDPGSNLFDGRMYYNTASAIVRVYDSTASAWVGLGAVKNIVGTANEVTVSIDEAEVATISLPDTIYVNVQGDLTGNADTASTLQTGRTISLGGDASGSAIFDGSEDITINVTLDSESAVDSLTGTPNEIDVSASVGAVTISLPDTINVDVQGNVTGDLTGNADTASALETSRVINLSGDVSGSVTFDGSASVDITTVIQPNSVELGTDTTGNYVASVSASDGISASGTGESASVTLVNTDKGSSQNIFKTISGDSGSFTAGSNSASATIAGGTGISTSASAGTVTVTNDGVVTLTGTTNQVDVSSSVGNSTVSLPSTVVFPGTVTLNADPGQALEAATKQYVDAVAEGLHVHASVEAATTASVDLSSPPATIDTFTLVDGSRVLVKDQSNAAENGIYVYNSASAALVRASDYDTAGEIQPGDFVFVSSGSVYAGTGWVQENAVTTLGTDPIVWAQFSGAGTFLAGNGLQLNGNVFSINTAVTVDVSTQQTLTNKTLTSPTVSGLYLSDGSIVVEGSTNNEFETTLEFTNPTQDNTVTVKNGTGTLAFTTDIPSTTDGLAEGTTNLYYTNERVEDAVGAMVQGTSTINVTYTDNGASAGILTIDTVEQASNSYLLSASGLAVDVASLETKLVTDSFTKKATGNLGNGAATSFVVTHGLATRDVAVHVYRNGTPYDQVEVDVLHYDASDPSNTNKVTIAFASAPTTNEYRVVIVG
jgi:hypothetical protein